MTKQQTQDEVDAKMARDLRSTLRHGGVYSIGVIAARLVGFLMLPVYTHILTPADYGVLELLSLSTDITAMIAGLGVGNAISRFYPEHRGTPHGRQVVGSAFAVLLATTGFVGVSAWFGSGAISDALFGSREQVPLVRLAFAGLLTGSLFEVPMVVLRARLASVDAVRLGLLRTAMSLSLNILFLVVLGMGVAGILLGTVMTSLSLGAILSWRILREEGFHVSPVMARRMIAFGAPLIVWSVASFILHYSDRYFLRAHESLAEVGRYSLAYKLAMLLPMLIGAPFAEAWLPKAAEVHRRDGDAAKPVLRRILRLYNLVLVTAAFWIAVFAADVVSVMTDASFHSAAAIVPALALAMIFFGWRQVTEMGALLRKRSGLIAAASGIAAAVALAGNAWLVPQWGAWGAVWATVIAFAIEALLMGMLSRRVYQLDLGVDALLRPLVVAVVVWAALASLGVGSWPVVARMSVNAAACAVLVGAFVATGCLDDFERHALRQAIRSPVSALRALRGAES